MPAVQFEPNLTKISPEVARWWSINMLKSEFQYYGVHTEGVSAFRFRTPEQRVKAIKFVVCKNAPNLIGYHNNVPQATAKLMSVLYPHTFDYLRW